jgi:hypothetical protein
METQLIIGNIYATARHMHRGESIQLTITPKRDRWQVRLGTLNELYEGDGGSLNEALLTVLTTLTDKAFPADMKE